ncbi:hypothetical protein RKE30_33440 [Streptomyces sp. Li-HN-5-11]|jgi:hypothetical protein|uniref:hypothetical protein n=1 Tax=Streptomyces sp. Li-HN-5-11 TaxID=3075432 RepID=UPI0028B1D6DB|nr:hypothetical protein [Streptomyces sp. Li-HN-5-11]WNM34930.1 hypothetical protein RKE30_33440 [Streptomyces sp. Li-HN-5-11]
MNAQTVRGRGPAARPARPQQQLTPLGAIDTREAALRSGWVADVPGHRQNRPTTFNSAV